MLQLVRVINYDSINGSAEGETLSNKEKVFLNIENIVRDGKFLNFKKGELVKCELTKTTNGFDANKIYRISKQKPEVRSAEVREEDGNTNSLGALPNGRLLKKNKFKRRNISTSLISLINNLGNWEYTPNDSAEQ